MAASIDDVERWDWQDLQRTRYKSNAAWLLLLVLLLISLQMIELSNAFT